MSVAKLNMGLALLGMGRIDAGRRLADEAVAEYERTGATAEIAETLREYGTYLEQAGDFKSALALFHRQQKLTAELALATREKGEQLFAWMTEDLAELIRKGLVEQAPLNHSYFSRVESTTE